MMTHIMKRFVETSASSVGNTQMESISIEEGSKTQVAEPPRSSEGNKNRPISKTPPSSSGHGIQRRSVPKADIAMAIERFQYAMLLAERKSAVGQLQTLWAEAEIPEESHRMIIPVLLNALVTDPRDTELMETMLELMQAIVTIKSSNSTIVLQEPHALDTILGLMQDPSPWIRGPTVQLIKKIQDGDSSGFATHILACQEGLRLLLEVIEDKREHIRDTAVQILLNMTSNQAPLTQRHVQQFLAFEEGFARLFQIIDLELEGHGIESPVLIDCLQVILNMIVNNTMTQSLLRETPFIPVLFPLLLGAGIPSANIEDEQEETSDESMPNSTSITGIKGTLDILACLVGPVYNECDPKDLDEISLREQTKRVDERGTVQNYLAQQYEVVQALAELACHGVEADRRHAFKVLKYLCEENESNQLMALTLSVSRPPAYLLGTCLELDVNHEETELGASARAFLDCIWCSDLAKLSILQHMHAPPPNENGPIEPLGRVLMLKLATIIESILQENTTTLSLTLKDAIKISWKCCTRWRSLLHNIECKVLALRVPGPNQLHAVSGSFFLNTCVQWLMKMKWTKAHYTLLLALFRIIVSWIQGCPMAINEIVTSIPTLSFFCQAIEKQGTSDLEIEFAGLSAMILGLCLDGVDGKVIQLTKEQVLGMITRQVGLQKFTDAFVQMQQLSSFRNLKRSADGFAVYDTSFIQLFKHVAESTRTGILNVYMGTAKEEDSRSKAYQDLIRMQDQQLHELQEQLKSGSSGPIPLQNELNQANQQIAELKHTQQSNETRIRGLMHANELVEKELQMKETELKRLKANNVQKEPSQQNERKQADASDVSQYTLRIEQLENDLFRLNRQMSEKDEELDNARRTIDMLTAHQQLVQPPSNDLKLQEELKILNEQVQSLEAQLHDAQEKHAITVSTLVTRHEQQLKQNEIEWQKKLDMTLDTQRSELEMAHSNQIGELNAQREKQQEELSRLESIFEQLQSESKKMQQLEDELSRLRSENTTNEQQESKNDSQQELLLLVGSMEIQCRSFREVLEQVLGKEGVDRALKLSEDRGAMNFYQY